MANPFKSKVNAKNFKRPEGAGNFDNMDDYNIVNHIDINSGTKQNTPINAKDIVNKEFVDDGFLAIDGNNANQDISINGYRFTAGDLTISSATPNLIIDDTSNNNLKFFINQNDDVMNFGFMRTAPPITSNFLEVNTTSDAITDVTFYTDIIMDTGQTVKLDIADGTASNRYVLYADGGVISRDAGLQFNPTTNALVCSGNIVLTNGSEAKITSNEATIVIQLDDDNDSDEVLKVRDGADNTLLEVSETLGVSTQTQPFSIKNIKSGSTQANAGASADEVWKTSGHASLPDNVLMIGV